MTENARQPREPVRTTRRRAASGYELRWDRGCHGDIFPRRLVGPVNRRMCIRMVTPPISWGVQRSCCAIST